MTVTGVFLDLSKAFDLVMHDVLLRRLENCGVGGVAQDIFRSYLDGRKQFVEIRGVQSGVENITRGVPQGSCLGPLLFLIYINDLARLSLSGRVYLFADDTSLFYSSTDVEMNCSLAESDLNLINSYFGSIGLSLNADKTRPMHFHTPHRSIPTNPSISLNGALIDRVYQFNYLGLRLDLHLN